MGVLSIYAARLFYWNGRELLSPPYTFRKDFLRESILPFFVGEFGFHSTDIWNFCIAFLAIGVVWRTNRDAASQQVNLFSKG